MQSHNGRDETASTARNVFSLTQNEYLVQARLLPALSVETKLQRLNVHAQDSRLGLTQTGLDWMGSPRCIKTALIAFFQPAES